MVAGEYGPSVSQLLSLEAWGPVGGRDGVWRADYSMLSRLLHSRDPAARGVTLDTEPPRYVELYKHCGC